MDSALTGSDITVNTQGNNGDTSGQLRCTSATNCDLVVPSDPNFNEHIIGEGSGEYRSADGSYINNPNVISRIGPLVDEYRLEKLTGKLSNIKLDLGIHNTTQAELDKNTYPYPLAVDLPQQFSQPQHLPASACLTPSVRPFHTASS